VGTEEAPEPAEAEGLRRVAEVDGGAPVPLPGEGEEGGGPDGRAAVEVAGEVDAEEREARVGDGVDVAADPAGRLPGEGPVRAPERHRPHGDGGEGEGGEPVGVEPAGGEDRPGADGPAPGPDEDGPALLGEPDDLLGRRHLAPGGGDVGGEGPGDGGEVGDRRRRGVEGGDPAHRRLEAADPGGVDPFEAGNAVRPGPPLEGVEAADLVPVGGDDELAGPGDGDAALGRVLLEEGLAPADEAGLLRPRRVVEAGVEDPGVVRALVDGDDPLLLDDEHGEPGPVPHEPLGGGEPDDAAADDDDVAVFERSHGRPRR